MTSTFGYYRDDVCGLGYFVVGALVFSLMFVRERSIKVSLETVIHR